jgi:hypothetical protein
MQVWPIPPEPVRWPAAVGVLDEHGLETLAQRFSPVGEAEGAQGDGFVSAADDRDAGGGHCPQRVATARNRNRGEHPARR